MRSTLVFERHRMPGIRMGDHLFLYAPGGSRSIFALAEATADPENDSNYTYGGWKLSMETACSVCDKPSGDFRRSHR
jgi:hypothetical protein